MTADKGWTGRKPVGQREETVDILDLLSWTVQPPLGLIKGEYYREENFFAPHFPGDPGYHGILEVVAEEGKILHVEFNEHVAPSYYIRKYQGASKRRGSFCFLQSTKARTAQTLVVLNNGIVQVEKQMLEENRLTGEFDLVTGASNSVKRSMLPLANKIDGAMRMPSKDRYYGLAEKIQGGLTARLQVIVSGGKIRDLFYDEIFADEAAEITEEALKPYYRQSKYHCLEYESQYPDGFNTLFDLLRQKVILTQDLMDIEGLPWTRASETRPRNPEWDRYLELAARIQTEIEADRPVRP